MLKVPEVLLTEGETAGSSITELEEGGNTNRMGIMHIQAEGVGRSNKEKITKKEVIRS